MIQLLIYHLHIIGALYAFTKNWQGRGLKDAFLSVMIIGLLFAIGWALTGTLAYTLVPWSWNDTEFNRDTISLLMLLIPEIFFFYFYIIKDKPEKDSKKTGR